MACGLKDHCNSILRIFLLTLIYTKQQYQPCNDVYNEHLSAEHQPFPHSFWYPLTN